MQEWLWTHGHKVNQKRICQLMRKISLEAIYQKPRMSSPGPDHKIYSYFLKGIRVSEPDHV